MCLDHQFKKHNKHDKAVINYDFFFEYVNCKLRTYEIFLLFRRVSLLHMAHSSNEFLSTSHRQVRKHAVVSFINKRLLASLFSYVWT